MSKHIEIFAYLDTLIKDKVSALIFKNDFEFLISVVLSAQTSDIKVNKVTKVLFSRYPSIIALKEAPINELESIIKEIGLYKNKARYIKEISEIIHTKYFGKIPKAKKELEDLPGVGSKTASLVLSAIYDLPYIAVDTHVARVSKRLGLAEKNDSIKVIERKLKDVFIGQNSYLVHTVLLLFGRRFCKAKKPLCLNCGLKKYCSIE